MIQSQAALNPGEKAFVNREFSWLQFNKRVLEEAARLDNPLMERLKFLAIFESNLDEFFMVRVSGLIEQRDSGVLELAPDGLNPEQQLAQIHKIAVQMRAQAAQLWNDDLRPSLQRAGILLRGWSELTPEIQSKLRADFLRDVFPLCTPIILDPAPSVPFISNLSLNLAVALSDASEGKKLARVKIPSGTPRAIKVGRNDEYILLEDLVQANLDTFFPGVQIDGSWRFRVVRDADIEIRELEAPDLIASIEGMIQRRRFGDPVLVEFESTTPNGVRAKLLQMLELDPQDVHEVSGLLGYDVLWELSALGGPKHSFPAFVPAITEPFTTGKGIFETLAKQDVLVHHPYDGFKPVLEFVAAAAYDPDVVGIKMTLYRVGAESPIVELLLEAAQRGKQVAVMVELKARFDESNNLVWARALERAGVHISYGFPEMKVHCKLCHVVRREGRKVKTYAHIGTGNYNPNTARVYTDLGLFTSDPEVTQDVSELFNFLTGFSRQTEFRQLLVAPQNLREGIIERIEREVEHHKLKGNGHVIFKLNALVDTEVIEALYEASQAGVRVDLLVRGISCIRPGIPGLSENIRVRSIVGRFLEHSRAYWFNNNGKPEVFIGSSDLMRRNLDRRIEVLTPVRSAVLTSLIREKLLATCWKDNTHTWEEQPDGTYCKRSISAKSKPFSAQNWLVVHPFTKLQFSKNRRA